jgi:endonuclease-3
MAPKTSRRGQQEAQRLHEIIQRLREHYPDATCALHHQNAFQLLVATILSAQCTDQRVNLVTPHLFARFPDPASLAAAPTEEVEDLIRTTGFFRNKARNLIGAARTLVERFGSEVPQTMEDLLTLPGVARKTANVVLGTWYGIPTGVVVDTHVARVSQRLGLTTHEDPGKIEQNLMRLLPREEWIDFAHRLIHHGRRLCKARTPLCQTCFLADLCPSAHHSPAGSKKK